jgi:hypothetical protein
MGSEHEVRALMACIDADGGGTVDVAELMQFLEKGERARRRSSGFGYADFDEPGPETAEGSAPRTAGHGARSPAKSPQSGRHNNTPGRPGGLRGDPAAPAHEQAPLTPDEELALKLRLKRKLAAASYTANGPDVEAMFRRFDKDGSGELDEAELRKVLRLTALGRLSL